MGTRPSWHVLITAARYLRVAPWDLLERPFIWTTWAMSSLRAESQSEVQRQKNAARRAKAKKGL